MTGSSLIQRLAAGLPILATLPAAAVPTPAAGVVVAATEATAPAWSATGLLQAALGLISVLALIFLCAWAARRLGLQRQGGGNRLKVVGSSMLGQRERVVIVEIGGAWLVLGVTPGRINALHTMPAAAATPALVPGHAFSSGTSFASSLAQKLQNALGKSMQKPFAQSAEHPKQSD